MVSLRISDVEREIGLYPNSYIDVMIIGLLNGKKPQEVKNMLVYLVDKHAKRVGNK